MGSFHIRRLPNVLAISSSRYKYADSRTINNRMWYFNSPENCERGDAAHMMLYVGMLRIHLGELYLSKTQAMKLCLSVLCDLVAFETCLKTNDIP